MLAKKIFYFDVNNYFKRGIKVYKVILYNFPT